jgi:hypothetical protein
MPHSAKQGGYGSSSGLGSSSPGNGGGRDRAFGAALMQEQRRALEQARRPQPNRPKPSSHPANLLPQYTPPAVIFDHVPGLPFYGVAGPTYAAPMPTRRKAGGYGGVARRSPIQFPISNF